MSRLAPGDIRVHLAPAADVNLKPDEGVSMLVDAGSNEQHRPDMMERGGRAAAAVAAGYLLAFSIAGADVTSWFLAAIVASGILAATASLRALPTKLRLVVVLQDVVDKREPRGTV